MEPVKLTVTSRRSQSRTEASPLILIYTFLGLIAVGTLLLLLPITHHGGGITPFLDALFTATSAVTVTGLTVQDTAAYWTRTGQVLIMAMVYVGGLGFMTFATFMLILIGQRISLSQRLIMREGLGASQIGGLVSLTVRVVIVATALQVLGFIALAVRFWELYPPAEAIWQAAFHAVSAFNNAGFVVLPASDSLSAFKSDGAVLGIIGTLVILGGLSYWVLADVVRSRRFRLFSLNTKLVLILTLLLLVSGTVVFWVSEYNNPETLGPMSNGQRALVSTFESISSRTAGFTTIDHHETKQHTKFFFTSLMFVGGASASVAGGIKINTIAIVLVAVLSTLFNRTQTRAFGRGIPRAQVQRAMSVGAVATAMVFGIALVLTFIGRDLLAAADSEFEFADLLFETVSAFGTVGLTTGLTEELSSLGRAVIIATMFIGRVGPLTFSLMMLLRRSVPLYSYAEERVTLG